MLAVAHAKATAVTTTLLHARGASRGDVRALDGGTCGGDLRIANNGHGADSGHVSDSGLGGLGDLEPTSQGEGSEPWRQCEYLLAGDQVAWFDGPMGGPKGQPRVGWVLEKPSGAAEAAQWLTAFAASVGGGGGGGAGGGAGGGDDGGGAGGGDDGGPAGPPPTAAGKEDEVEASGDESRGGVQTVGSAVLVHLPTGRSVAATFTATVTFKPSLLGAVEGIVADGG